MQSRKPSICIAVHEVAPASWPLVARLLDMLDATIAGPVTLLVVPDYHRRGRICDDMSFVRAVDRRRARGDDIAMHGFVHLDEARAPRSPREFLTRRLLTRGEGEFAALDAAEACRRIDQALALWRSLDWPVTGFVPPAWLLSPGSRQALSQYSFSYVTTRLGLYRLPDWRLARGVVLAYSPYNTWRRQMSRAVIAAQCAAARDSPLRVALHPVDAIRDDVLRYWAGLIRQLALTHTVITKSAWANQARLDDGGFALAG